jgi:hypothetical protein
MVWAEPSKEQLSLGNPQIGADAAMAPSTEQKNNNNFIKKHPRAKKTKRLNLNYQH